MYRKGIMLLLSMLLLAGCWDERLYKNASVVTLVGVDGYVGGIQGGLCLSEFSSSAK